MLPEFVFFAFLYTKARCNCTRLKININSIQTAYTDTKNIPILYRF